MKENILNSDIKLGVDIGKLMNDYYYKDLVDFLKNGTEHNSSSFSKLKPLFDKYGYEKVIDTILELERAAAKDIAV